MKNKSKFYKVLLDLLRFIIHYNLYRRHGRLSRFLSTLLLLKNGYKWIQYVSLEHEFESRKNEYYLELRKCQAELFDKK